MPNYSSAWIFRPSYGPEKKATFTCERVRQQKVLILLGVVILHLVRPEAQCTYIFLAYNTNYFFFHCSECINKKKKKQFVYTTCSELVVFMYSLVPNKRVYSISIFPTQLALFPPQLICIFSVLLVYWALFVQNSTLFAYLALLFYLLLSDSEQQKTWAQLLKVTLVHT